MPKKRQTTDYDESGLEVRGQEEYAAGRTSVAVSLKRSLERMGPVRTARTLLELNQAGRTRPTRTPPTSPRWTTA